MRRAIAAIACLCVSAVIAASCGPSGPQDIDTSADACSRCRMSIGQLAHAGEMLTADGRIRKYDSIGCLVLDYGGEARAGRTPRSAWVLDYDSRQWLKVEDAYFALAAMRTDHMGYGIAAARTREVAIRLVGGSGEKVVRWAALPRAVASMETQRDD